MHVCYSGFPYSTLSTFNLSVYYLKQCTCIYTKILDWLEQKLEGGLSPLGLAT